jgi:arabinofuranan 3-O-arabinosyltransferase
MLRKTRELAVPVSLWVGSLALAFAQRPGLATSDTKINLHVDPGRFLGDVASMWTSTSQLGGVEAGQQTGYLFPMGPFFAVGHDLGISDWVVQRLWLGILLALAAWGAARLTRLLLGRPSAIAELTAGAVTVLNPFTVTYANRTTVTLLAYAALPWLLLAVHRGLREPRGWRWPAAVAVLVAASGGGVNGAVTAWMLVAPLLLLLYEALFTPEVAWGAVRSFVLRAAPLTLALSVWWIVPAYVQSSYGIDFLHFTEQPGTIWGTTSITESLRLMSFWLSYAGIGFAGKAIPYFDDSNTLLFSVPVLLATLLLPAAALTGFVWTRRSRYGPFFLMLALLALLIMGAGFPDGTPLRHGLTFTYNHVAAIRFLRASYKAAPLLAIALACLAGAGAAAAWRRLPGVAPRVVACACGTAILILAAWPLVSGTAQDAQVSYKRIPAAWRDAASDLDRQLPANSRAIVLPGDLFSFYTWGGTTDPILPALSSRPVAERAEVPYSDLRSTDLLWTIDGLVHQQRLLPGQLKPLLSLIGVRSVITGTDDDLARSDAPPPADAAAQLEGPGELGPAARSYGPRTKFAPTGVGPSVSLPEVRRYDLGSSRGLIGVEPRAEPTIVDGSAAGIAELAAFGGVNSDRAIRYAADMAPAQLRAAAASGASIVITDSNRRQAFVPGSLEQNTSATLPAGEDVASDGELLDPFARGPDAETVASFTGIASVQAPFDPLSPQFPEYQPFAAIDGSVATAWLADPTLTPAQRWLQVDFVAPISIPYVELMPYDDAGGSVRAVAIAGRTYSVHPGWNRLALGLHHATSLQVSLSDVSPPLPGNKAGAGGITELRIPGIRATEQLRLPVDSEQALSGADLRGAGLTYLFERTTGDDPYQRDLAHGPKSAMNVDQPGDGEQYMRREIDLPASRSFTATAWVEPFSRTSDSVLDRLAGYAGPVVASSSSRFDGEPRWRASSALDGDPGTAWIGDYDPPSSAWIAWSAPRVVTLRTLRLRPAELPVRRPAVVRVSWPGGSTPALAVGPGGVVTLPQPVRARSFRLTVLRAVAPAGASAAERRAVGIASIGGAPRVTMTAATSFRARCGSVAVQVGAVRISLRVSGSESAFETGVPMQAPSCGRPISLAAGSQLLTVAAGPLAVDDLELSSPAPSPVAVASPGGGSVIDPGTTGRGSYSNVRLSVSGPSWLVLGESYDRGWRAWCGGRSLGAPVPIDGFANGWPVGPSCHDARFSFAPNRLAAIGYLISGIAAVLCVVLLLVPLLSRRRRRASAPVAEIAASPLPEAPYSPIRSVGAAVLSAAAFGFVFGISAGLVAAPVIAVCLWRGVGAKPLTLTAGALLGIVVPILYLTAPGDESAGNHSTYPVMHMSAHWIGVAAFGMLTGALWRSLRGGSRSSSAPAPPPPGESRAA